MTLNITSPCILPYCLLFPFYFSILPLGCSLTLPLSIYNASRPSYLHLFCPTLLSYWCNHWYREYAGTKKMRFKPVIISHHMLMGLKEGQEKMSKSDPDSAIFMEDAAEDVKRKVCSHESSQIQCPLSI